MDINPKSALAEHSAQIGSLGIKFRNCQLGNHAYDCLGLI